MSYEIHSCIPSSCVPDENGMFLRAEGERRVKNVLVSGEPIDPARTYTLACHDYIRFEGGDGFSVFRGAPVLLDRVKLDNHTILNLKRQSVKDVQKTKSEKVHCTLPRAARREEKNAAPVYL